MEIFWNLFEFIVTIFEAFVFMHFVCAFLGHNFKTRKGKLVYIIGSIGCAVITVIFNSLTIYEGILGILYSIYYFLFSLIFLKGTFIKKLFVSILTNIISVCTNIFVTNILTTAFHKDINYIYAEQGPERFILIVTVQTILIYVCGLILRLSSDKKFSLKLKEWFLIILVFTVSFVSLMFIHITLLESSDSGANETKLLFISELGIIAVNIICFYMTITLNKSHEEALKLKLINQTHEERAKYAENVRKQYEEIRSIRHDMKQNLAVISALQKEGKFTEAMAFTDKCTDNMSKLDMPINVGNDFINAILSTKLSLAKEKGISMVCRSSKDVTGIEDVDLCVLLGNILDNAIEACEKSTVKNIDSTIYSDSDKLIITVINTTDSSVLNKNPDLKTDKPDKASHGYGVKTIRSIAEKYGGNASFYEEDDKFICQVNIFK